MAEYRSPKPGVEGSSPPWPAIFDCVFFLYSLILFKKYLFSDTMKIQYLIRNTANFINEVGVELKKSTWPTRPELFDSTMVVLLSVIVLAVFIGISDFFLVKLLGLLL